ncbi:MAG TPA: hypothetical protein DD713_04230 [Nitrospiraceae bacterium]|nr:hypothetical protein [Nitrospiraceae bacterium]
MVDCLQTERIEVNIPNILPVLPLRDVVAFPNLILPLLIGRQKSMNAVEHALRKGKVVFLIAQRDINVENPLVQDVYTIGTIGMILRTIRSKETRGKIKVLVQGICKARLIDLIQIEPIWIAIVIKEVAVKSAGEIVDIEPLVLTVKEKLGRLVFNYGKAFPIDVMVVVENSSDPEKLAFLIAANLGLESSQTQEILEIDNPTHKLMRVNEILDNQIGLLTARNSPKKYDE